MTLITDNFNRADGSLGASWATVSLTPTVSSNQISLTGGASSNWCVARNVGSVVADQYAQLLCNTNNCGPLIRFTAGVGGYGAHSSGTTLFIGKYNASGVRTSLVSVSFTSTAPYTLRLRAVGTTLELLVDGVVRLTTTDATYSSGSSGAVGYSATLGDDFEADEYIPVSDSINITSPQVNQIIQRTGTTFAGGTASISISGTYVGTPTSIEARFAGGSWTTIVASPSGGTFSGTLTGQPAGQGAVEVRFSNDTGITDSVSDVGIGEVFAPFGQSNAVCLATNPQSWSAPSAYTHYKPGVQKYNGSNWLLMADHVFNTTEESAASGKGSCYPRLATLLMESLGVPVGFVTTGKGTTSLVGTVGQWDKAGDADQYDKAVATANLSQINAIRAILWYQGEADTLGSGAGTNSGRSAYAAALSTLLNNFQADCASLASAKMVCATLAEYVNASTSDSDLTAIRMAQVDAIDADADIFFGPVGYEQNHADNAHWTSDAQISRLADLWYCSIMSAFFGGSQGYAPRLTHLDSSGSTLVLTFDRDLLTSDSSYGTASFFATDNTGTLTISSASRTGTREVTLTCSRAIDGDASVSLGRGNTAVGLTVPRSADITLPDSTTVNLIAAPFELLAVSDFAPTITGVAVESAIMLSDTAYDITFSGDNLLAETVDILLSRDNGSNFAVIASAVSSTSPYEFIPTSGQISATAIIRVRVTSDPSVYDDSTVFVIATTEATGGGTNTALWFRLQDMAVTGGLELSRP